MTPHEQAPATTVAERLLAPRALYEDVAELLRQRIFKRDLQPGSWIDEAKLAEECGISRTPLREALKVLAAEGLVTMKVRRGAYVAEVSETDLRDVYHLLSLLESDAAGAAASRVSDDELRELHDIQQQMEAAAPQPEFLALNERFHMRVLEIGGNRWLNQMVADLRKVMKLHRHNSLLKPGRVQEAIREHRAVLRALARRDPVAAAAKMRTHFEHGLEAAG